MITEANCCVIKTVVNYFCHYIRSSWLRPRSIVTYASVCQPVYEAISRGTCTCSEKFVDSGLPANRKRTFHSQILAVHCLATENGQPFGWTDPKMITSRVCAVQPAYSIVTLWPQCVLCVCHVLLHMLGLRCCHGHHKSKMAVHSRTWGKWILAKCISIR